MEQVINAVLNGGVGVGSFIALLYFGNKFLTSNEKTLKEIASTLTDIKESLSALSHRVDDIEDKLKGK